jgi:D-alanyl-D-alanine carboxypeptidase
MLRIRTGARHGLRWGVFGLVGVAVIAGTSLAAQAAPYADIVVDGNSGDVLHATNPDAKRHPASLTKIMTLYLLFEQLEAGKLRLDSPLEISEEAAGQAPTKLGLKAGTSIQVEDAIKGIITRSANDAAVVVAEAIAGDEDDFAKLMTRKARSLGMTRTVYKNASGLPDDDQVTTARDQSILGRAIQERFPRYYKYFSTRSFTFRGQWIGNHNRLLGRVEGVDGIKTGYIRASGFNLVTSVHRGNRHIVAVVMGGSSAKSRDAKMRDLINETIATASTKRTAPMIAQVGESQSSKGRAEPGFAVASATSVPARVTPLPAAAPRRKEATTKSPAALPRPEPGSSEPIRPVLVKTFTVRARTQTASLAPLHVPALPFAEPQPVQAAMPVVPPAPAPATTPAALRDPVATAPAAPGVAPVAAKIETAAPSQNEGQAGSGALSARVVVAELAPPTPAKPQVRSGWMIQVGAFPAEEAAKQQLSAVQSKASKILTGADPFTETVEKSGTTYYRARFAGLDKGQAEAACKYLKRNDVDCVTIKN